MLETKPYKRKHNGSLPSVIDNEVKHLINYLYFEQRKTLAQIRKLVGMSQIVLERNLFVTTGDWETWKGSYKP